MRSLKDFDLNTRPANCDKHGEYTQRAIPTIGEKIIWTHCSKCVQEEIDREAIRKAAEEAERRQSAAEARLLSAGVPERFKTRSIENFVADTPEQNQAKEIAADFSASFREHRRIGTSMVFSGNPGTGKSHLAIAILQEAMKGGTGMYLNALDMVRMVRETWRRESKRSEVEVLDTLGSIDLLVIDEVGLQYGTDGEQMIIFDVLNRRYRDCMPTIMLTNLKSKDFEQYVGARVFDRLKENGIWVRFSWDSHRGKKLSEV